MIAALWALSRLFGLPPSSRRDSIVLTGDSYPGNLPAELGCAAKILNLTADNKRYVENS